MCDLFCMVLHRVASTLAVIDGEACHCICRRVTTEIKRMFCFGCAGARPGQRLQTSFAMSSTTSRGSPARINLVVPTRAKIVTESTSMLKMVFSFNVVQPGIAAL